MLNSSEFIVSLLVVSLGTVYRFHSHFLSLSPFSIRTPQHKSSPESSSDSTPTNEAPHSYDEQLRLAMELSAREQEEAELRQRQEEEELQRIIQLSLMEKWYESEQTKFKGQESICSNSVKGTAILSSPVFCLCSSSNPFKAQGSNSPTVTEICLCPIFTSLQPQAIQLMGRDIQLVYNMYFHFFFRQFNTAHSYVRDLSISHKAICYLEFLECHTH